jgi:hypothetical protein
VWHVGSVLSDHATTLANAYGLGLPVTEMIMVARGEQGRVWRFDTDTGGFAIKELVVRQTAADAAADVSYQEAVLACGAVPMPRPIRTVTGQVLVDVAGHQVRAYEWVALLAVDRDLDRRWSEQPWRQFTRGGALHGLIRFTAAARGSRLRARFCAKAAQWTGKGL